MRPIGTGTCKKRKTASVLKDFLPQFRRDLAVALAADDEPEVIAAKLRGSAERFRHPAAKEFVEHFIVRAARAAAYEATSVELIDWIEEAASVRLPEIFRFQARVRGIAASGLAS